MVNTGKVLEKSQKASKKLISSLQSICLVIWWRILSCIHVKPGVIVWIKYKVALNMKAANTTSPPANRGYNNSLKVLFKDNRQATFALYNGL